MLTLNSRLWIKKLCFLAAAILALSTHLVSVLAQDDEAEQIGGVGTTPPGGDDNNVASIIGGTRVPAGRYRGYAIPSGGGMSGAQLVHPSILLSAAHTQPVWRVGTRAYIGATLKDGSDAVEIRTIQQVVKHPDAVVTDSPFNYENDIMLLKLDLPSNEPPRAWNTNPDVPAVGDALTIIGFGWTRNNDPSSLSPYLLEAEFDALSDQKCIDRYKTGLFVKGIMMCAEGSDKSVAECRGDSGSPVIDTQSGNIAGIVSFSSSSGCGGAGVHTRVSTYDGWIEDTICSLTGGDADYCCGDGICGSAERCGSCPQDCGACPNPSCGDGACDAGTETCSSCPQDCGTCSGPFCGDGKCDAGSETCETCSQDCGACAGPTFCGDGKCDVEDGEYCFTCRADCGECLVCGT